MKESTKRITYKGIIATLPENRVFVFGSNMQGRHGKGAAKFALDTFGAIYGIASGFQGKSYAIITKNLRIKHHPSVTRDSIVSQIKSLYNYAHQNPCHDFYIAYSGNGINLNGYTSSDMASMFSQASQKAGYIPENVIFEEVFSDLVSKKF